MSTKIGLRLLKISMVRIVLDVIVLNKNVFGFAQLVSKLGRL